MADGSPITAPSFAEQSPNIGADVLVMASLDLDLARNQFRARQFPGAFEASGRLIQKLEALLTGPAPLTPRDAARARCLEACALTLRGRCAEELGNVEDAHRMWQEAIVYFHDNVALANPSLDTLGYYGAASRLTGDRKRAIQIFEEVVSKGGAVPETFRHYGLALKEEGRYAEAATQLRLAVSLASSDLRSWRGLAEALESLSNQPGGELDREANRKASAEAYFSLAAALRDASDNPAALEAVDNSLRLDAHRPAALLLRGDLLRLNGKFADAVAVLDQYLALQPEQPEALATKGASLFMLGHLDEALTLLSRAVELSPEYAWAIAMTGAVLMAQSRFTQAIELLERALAINPSLWAAAAELSRAFVVQIQPERAIEAADRALAVQPDSPLALSMRGLALFQTGRNPESLACFDQAVLKNPTYDFALSRKSLPLVELNRYEEAIAALRQAIQLNALDYWSHCRLGEILSRSTDPDIRAQAVSPLKTALELGPDADTSASLAGIMANLELPGEANLWNEALLAADRALQLNSNSTAAFLYKAQVLGKLDRKEEALVAIDSALQLYPGSPGALYIKADLLLGLGQPDRALEAIEGALAAEPKDGGMLSLKARILVEVADALQGKGENEAALKHLAEAIEIAPDYAMAHAIRGFVLHAVGQHAPAEAALVRALELDSGLIWAHAELAGTYRDLDKYNLALDSVDHALSLEPDYASAIEIKARIFIDIGENENALSLCEQALKLEPKLWTSRYWKALALDNLERVQEALDIYRESHLANPEDVWSRRGMADMLLLLRQDDAAVEQFEWILTKTPEEKRTITDLSLCGWCHYGCGRLDYAVQFYAEAISLDSAGYFKNNGFDLALVIGCSKRYSRAKIQYERALEQVRSCHAWARKGIFHVAHNDLKRAMTIRHPHLNESPEMRECAEMLENAYRTASDDPTRPNLSGVPKALTGEIPC
jgi:tetratricopeptide (TPR) repeat protein